MEMESTNRTLPFVCLCFDREDLEIYVQVKDDFMWLIEAVVATIESICIKVNMALRNV